MRIAVIGGDRRMLYAAAAFSLSGHTVTVSGFDTAKLPDGLRNIEAAQAISQSELVILPVRPADGESLNAPFADDRISLTALGELIGERPVFSGGADRIRPYLQGRIYDYTAREDFAVHNAVLTVEGAIGLLVQEYSDCIFGAKTLILGYGRIGRVLSRYLRAFGAEVTVAARSEVSRAWARAEGMAACDFPVSTIGTYRILINTVPAPVLNAEQLCALGRDAVVMELASAPGGIDRSAAQALGVRCIHAPGLPGRTSPVAAGRIIKDTISHIIKEENGGKDNSRLCDDRFLLHL